jgi:hypothetical protein
MIMIKKANDGCSCVQVGLVSKPFQSLGGRQFDHSQRIVRAAAASLALQPLIATDSFKLTCCSEPVPLALPERIEVHLKPVHDDPDPYRYSDSILIALQAHENSRPSRAGDWHAGLVTDRALGVHMNKPLLVVALDGRLGYETVPLG